MSRDAGIGGVSAPVSLMPGRFVVARPFNWAMRGGGVFGLIMAGTVLLSTSPASARNTVESPVNHRTIATSNSSARESDFGSSYATCPVGWPNSSGADAAEGTQGLRVYRP